MLPLRIELDINSIETWFHSLEASLDAQVRAALELVCSAVAESARDSHPYQNRTGDLEAMTQPGGIAGSFYSDTLIGDVTAGMPYASYVEEKGFEFLMPAWERSEGRVDRILDGAIEQAVRLIG